MKYLLTLGLIALGLWLWLRGRRRELNPPAAEPRRPDARAATVQDMVVCAHCGVHFPQAEAFWASDGRPYCSEAHRSAGPR